MVLKSLLNCNLKKTLCALMVTGSICFTPVHAGFLTNSVYEKIGISENVDPYLLYSISLVESAKAANIRSEIRYVAPHAYAIRTPQGAIYPKTYTEAVSVLKQQLKKYKKRELDVGLMQINGLHFSKVQNVEELLDPEINIKVAATILKEAMKSGHTDMAIKIGRYHSYTAWRAQAYGQRVLAVYDNLKNMRGSDI